MRSAGEENADELGRMTPKRSILWLEVSISIRANGHRADTRLEADAVAEVTARR
jgi:hypothetical protein